MIFISFMFGFIMCVVLMMVYWGLLGEGYESNNNKNMIFECGVMMDKLSRKSFSLRFFLFIILFLIFEMEIILFIPISLIQDFNILNMLLMIMIMIFLLGGGLLYEWFQGILVWIFNDIRDF